MPSTTLDASTSKFEEFLREKYYPELLKAVKDEKAVVIDFDVFDRHDPITADMLLEEPAMMLKSFDEAVLNIVEEPIKVRFRNLPESRQHRIRNLRAKHLGKFIQIDATIKSATEVRPQIHSATFECPDCSAKINVLQDGNLLTKPIMCECGRRGDFPLINKNLIDTRWVTGIEPFEITTGEQPGELPIFMKEDLTTPKMQKKTDPGSSLRITGVLKELPRRIKGKQTIKMDIYLETNHIETREIEYEDLDITPEDEMQIRNLANDPDIYEKLKLSIAPGIYGFEEIKEAVALQLFGGVAHYMPDGSRVRGNVHILLCGDPGTGKTVMLKLVSSVVPRGKYVSGSGVSGVGLTASVRKDEVIGTWVLEAGALILANKSVISIDEFDKMSRDDQTAMHEAMSVETVSIAKASIVATLPAQTAVLAGANPQYGRFDTYKTIIEQIQIPETLLSRFDLKFAIIDKPDKITDERLADHIIMSRTDPQKVVPVIDLHLLRKYIAYAKQVVKDLVLTDDAAQVLKRFYIEMRSPAGEGGPIGITLRQYEALLRLAEASAKVRLDTHVRREDAERAMRLMQFSLRQLGFDRETGFIDIDKLEGGITTGKRKRLNSILEIIEKLQQTSREVAEADILAEAQNQGISEKDAQETIEKLRKDGTIFEPRGGFYRKT
ncbi:MAG: minichromosome maintenance protein MCM [Candidatus Aenigmarchaeota archaeon]|nr:minichromosome maintenance protein MCM [Candidatus Aenigmarchaeota archaeon]